MTSTFTLITGASSGIGRETAKRLAGDRALILGGRDHAALEATRAACANAADHVLWPYDLRDVGGIETSLATLLAERGRRVDCFIHSAGITKILPMRAMGHETALELMNVNALSAFEICRLLVRKKINHAALTSVVMISSTSSRIGEKGANVYCASKGAIDAFVRSLAVELAPEVRVNAVLPGLTRTAMGERWVQHDSARRMEDRFPLGFGDPADVAGVVAFLVSEEARWITGQQIVVDGGRTAT